MSCYRQFANALLMVAVIAATGCASKMASEQDLGPRPVDQAVTPATDVTQKPQPLGVESQPLQSGPAADHQAVAGLQRVYFAYNQFTLEAEARATLEQNAVYLRKNPGVKVVIEGHCDDRGSDEYNLALGERRAVTVKNYLVSLGIAADRLSIISYGEEQPLVAAADEESWARNRRAEFKVAR